MTDKADEKPEGTVRTTQARPAVTTPKPAPERKPWEQWVAEKRPAAGEVLSAKTLHRWPVGKQVTEAEFDAALVAARNLVFR